MGVDIARAAALAAGHGVIAAGRNLDKVTAAIGAAEHLQAVKLDITNLASPAGW
jgi:ribulose-5-phosphate 4-epimerase/fuculose-1-phosphate aldolase